MLSTDKKDFSMVMANCWQNFRTAINASLIDDWFEELRSFEFFYVNNAFKIYVRENEKFPPTLAIIIRLAKKSAGEQYVKVRESRPRKCTVQNCMEAEVDQCWYEPNVLICRPHMEEMVLKAHPHSIDARIIRESREFESQARELGISNEEHFRNVNPRWKEKLNKMIVKDKLRHEEA